jgi:hypothetical protein
MDALGDAVGVLTTRPVRFSGKRLFVNADVANGEVRVEVLDSAGEVIKRFAKTKCVPVRGDGTRQAVRWRGVGDLGSLAGQAVRLRFYVQGGGLYSFWVSPDASGASYGYVAAGGPGFTEPRDTVGDGSK